MFSSPSRRPGLKTVPLKGFFKDGVWHCNCDPRLPAAHFQTKKEGPNQGKWFYTCQKPKEESCGFFLWDDAAITREMRAVINNTRTEPDGLRTPADASRDKKAAGGTSNQWIQDLGKKKEVDEYGEDEWSQEDVQAVVQATERPVPGAYPETPRKSIKTNQFLTPNSKRKRDDDFLITPITGSKGDDVFGTPSTNRMKGGMWDGSEKVGLRSPSVTPTPGRFRDASVVSVASDSQSQSQNQNQGQNNYDITDEVMELLKDQDVDEVTSTCLRTLLNRHALKISGIAKGRDISRIALKAKDGKIAELQQKITALEADREMDKAIIRQLALKS